jgi:hypothetical protein
VERQPGVDDVLDDQDVAALDRGIEVLQEADRGGTARLVGRVARQLDEVDVVQDRDRAREVGEEDEARLQRRDEERFAALVVGGDLGAELGDPDCDLLGREVDLSDPVVTRVLGTCRPEIQEASFSPYRCPRRSMSRL